MSDIDLSLNRVYWEYLQSKSTSQPYMRPRKGYLCSTKLPVLGCRVTCPEYRSRSASFYNDLTGLVSKFAHTYSSYKFTLALSGGIDSEATAEAFYQLGIPFTAITLRLFGGQNDFDIVYAAKYCKDRNIEHKVVKLGEEKFVDSVLVKAEKYGQFTHSLSQMALTHLFDFVDDDTILIYSGHNPDVHHIFGWGWWEDSPNLVKYAINTNKKFFTFTSLEPIFLHYTSNWDGSQPGEKDNTFLYEAFPSLPARIKRTGWEKLQNHQDRILKDYREKVGHPHQTFITWDSVINKAIKNYEIKFERKLPKTDWENYKNLTENMKIRNV